LNRVLDAALHLSAAQHALVALDRLDDEPRSHRTRLRRAASPMPCQVAERLPQIPGIFGEVNLLAAHWFSAISRRSRLAMGYLDRIRSMSCRRTSWASASQPAIFAHPPEAWIAVPRPRCIFHHRP